MYVVKGVIKGWNMSVENRTSGGSFGYVSGNDIWNRKTAGAYGPRSNELINLCLKRISKIQLGVILTITNK